MTTKLPPGRSREISYGQKTLLARKGLRPGRKTGELNIEVRIRPAAIEEKLNQRVLY
jgi:hypothetical protein